MLNQITNKENRAAIRGAAINTANGLRDRGVNCNVSHSYTSFGASSYVIWAASPTANIHYIRGDEFGCGKIRFSDHGTSSYNRLQEEHVSVVGGVYDFDVSKMVRKIKNTVFQKRVSNYGRAKYQ